MPSPQGVADSKATLESLMRQPAFQCPAAGGGPAAAAPERPPEAHYGPKMTIKIALSGDREDSPRTHSPNMNCEKRRLGNKGGIQYCEGGNGPSV